ncbi:DUF1330 domain-containing protein [Novosphingobium sp. Gsoil 351]|uniref:DUF1330 domain-containing protein n=1 Tax=Novosphingobium sp. Gsoil 351 TaxID=2675225 RepID=UPI0012B4C3B4|nr:DUF1330 domain-containing protein [Novosphingobium sp. Gsoil 351]QGN55822.1 DUF1330 domain-containing protein [Novosphingobium sp. Gsoil 351]
MDPCFLTLKSGCDATAWADRAAAHRGTVLAAADAAEVTVLEPGSRHTGLTILRFAFPEDRSALWSACADLIAADPALVALASNGIAWEGWPGNFVPTIATVEVPAADTARCFMVIEGTGTDQARMDRYRDIILPMMRERGAYYVVFELGGAIEVWAGAWAEGIFAISRWPSRAHAEDFWFSERYQGEAIPIRTGVGRFDVQIVDGVAG